MTQVAVESTDDNIEHWISTLQGADLPAMGQVVKELNKVLNNPDSSAKQVAAVILRDASLTAKVLKVASSVTHIQTRPRPQPQSPLTSTSSSASSAICQSVVKLGVQGVKAICISVMLVESLLRRPNVRERLLFCLSRAFYAASQARMLLSDDQQHRSEEVVIAALLRHLGEMLFWSSNTPQLEQCSHRVIHEGLSVGDMGAELNLDFNCLTKHFAGQWQLGDLLLESLKAEEVRGELAQVVVLGDQISSALADDWRSTEFRTLVSQVAALKGIEDAQALELIRRGIKEGEKMAESFSAANVSDFMQAQTSQIEDFLLSVKPVEIPEEGKSQSQSVENITVMQPDLERQMAVLDSLWKMIANKSNMNTIFNMLVDGLHHSLGMERVVIAITNPERTKLSAKYIRGEDNENWRQSFNFSIRKREDNILAYCLENKEPIWVCEHHTPSLMHLVSDEMKQVIEGVDEFVCAPIYSGDKPIAVFYADRGKTGVEISEAQFQSFCRFAQQAAAGINMLA